MQFGDKVPQCGADKLAIIDWLYHVLKLKDPTFCKRVAELGVPTLLLSLLKKYYVNSGLHLKVFNIFNESIGSGLDHCFDAVRFYVHRG